MITMQASGSVGLFNFNLVAHKSCQNVHTLHLADQAVVAVKDACQGRVRSYAGAYPHDWLALADR